MGKKKGKKDKKISGIEKTAMKTERKAEKRAKKQLREKGEVRAIPFKNAMSKMRVCWSKNSFQEGFIRKIKWGGGGISWALSP